MNSTMVPANRLQPSPHALASFGVVKRRYHASSEGSASAPSLTASNDAAFDREASTMNELAAWAQRTSMANGFGEAALGGAPFPVAFSPGFQEAARAGRSASLREILAAMLDAARDHVRRWVAQWKQYRLEQATFRALSELDARTLHDLGLARNELRSVAIELTGESEPTRAHALMRLRNLSI